MGRDQWRRQRASILIRDGAAIANRESWPSDKVKYFIILAESAMETDSAREGRLTMDLG
jgi:hypothetical protein